MVATTITRGMVLALLPSFLAAALMVATDAVTISVGLDYPCTDFAHAFMAAAERTLSPEQFKELEIQATENLLIE
ncbi:hypothetical protein [Marinobacterium sp. BA1]|uniref:hypothetical protein n=1 Tax=Marinobacterium sp. BA1 TaxID=3138931 RepID=UPI0032E54A8B